MVKLPLPIARVEPTEAVRWHPTAGAGVQLPVMPVQLRGVDVLLVDDDVDSIGLVRTVLERAGTRC